MTCNDIGGTLNITLAIILCYILYTHTHTHTILVYFDVFNIEIVATIQ